MQSTNTAAVRPRRIELSACFNARDLGGYVGHGGKVVRHGQLFRADGLHRLADDDVVVLCRTGIRTVLDLRAPSEIEVTGHVAGDGLTVVHLPVLQRLWSEEALEGTDDPVSFLTERYLAMLTEGAPALTAALELVASDVRRPLVFHCSAGKDRTGVLAALVLALLGVDDDTIAADYHASASAMEQLMAWFEVHRPEVVDSMLEQPAAFRDCPPQAMHGFLAEVRERHGSVEHLVAELGGDGTTVEKLRADLLA